MNNHKVVLVTGASSGIGKYCAQFLSQQGHRVNGTSRKAGINGSARSSLNTDQFQMIQMDVTDNASVKK